MDGSPGFKNLYEEEERKRREANRAREIAEKGRQEEQVRREEEQRRREEEQSRTEKAEKQTSRTTPTQYLDACHMHLQAGLAVQSFALSTKGDPSNALLMHG